MAVSDISNSNVKELTWKIQRSTIVVPDISSLLEFSKDSLPISVWNQLNLFFKGIIIDQIAYQSLLDSETLYMDDNEEHRLILDGIGELHDLISIHPEFLFKREISFDDTNRENSSFKVSDEFSELKAIISSFSNSSDIVCVITEDSRIVEILKSIREHKLSPAEFIKLNATDFKIILYAIGIISKEELTNFLSHKSQSKSSLALLMEVTNFKGSSPEIFLTRNIEFNSFHKEVNVVLSQIHSIEFPGRELENQYQIIKKILEHSTQSGNNFIIFPENSIPFQYLPQIHSIFNNAESEFVCILPVARVPYPVYKAAFPNECLGSLFSNATNKYINFIRIYIKAKGSLLSLNQLKFSESADEASMISNQGLQLGDTIYAFESNWGNFLFLICRDFIAEPENGRLKSLNDSIREYAEKIYQQCGKYLDYIFIPTCNTDQEVFIINSAAFFLNSSPLQSSCILSFVNHAAIGESLIISPQKRHPRLSCNLGKYSECKFNDEGLLIKFPPACRVASIWRYHQLIHYLPSKKREYFTPVDKGDEIKVPDKKILDKFPKNVKIQTQKLFNNFLKEYNKTKDSLITPTNLQIIQIGGLAEKFYHDLNYLQKKKWCYESHLCAINDFFLKFLKPLIPFFARWRGVKESNQNIQFIKDSEEIWHIFMEFINNQYSKKFPQYIQILFDIFVNEKIPRKTRPFIDYICLELLIFFEEEFPYFLRSIIDAPKPDS